MIEVFESEPLKQRVFQTMLLHNNSKQEVEVHEDKKIDFEQLCYHLEKGGSVFITSRNSKKLRTSKPKGKRNERDRRILATFYFNHV